MGWKDREYQRTDGGALFPFIQWINDGAYLDPRNRVGGFGQSTDQVAIQGADIPGDERLLVHRDGSSTEVIFTQVLDVAPLERRFVWIKDGQALAGYEPGARGKLQVVCLVRSAENDPIGPVVLTFKGIAGKRFSAALKKHRQTVQKATEGKAPSYAFFGTFAAGNTEMVGQGSAQSLITPVEYHDAGFDPDVAFVGNEALDALDWEQIDAWKAAWDNGSGGNGRGESEDEDIPGFDDEDEPATGPQWGLIRKLFEQLGVTDRAKQNANLTEKGFDPEKLTKDEASELIERLQAAKAKKEAEVPF